jgi:hypothetical protein
VGLDADEDPQAQFIDWLVPQSSSAAYVSVKPFYYAQPGRSRRMTSMPRPPGCTGTV